MTAIQSVHISGHQERLEPKTHTVYQIDIRGNVRSWSIWRRYSEFDDLHVELVKGTGSPPPVPLPPKHKYSILRSHNNPSLLEERKTGLEAYLRAIIGAKEDKWREAFVFKEFLGIPVGRQGGVVGGPPTQFTLTSWLDEHQELQNRLRDVRADINKREALSNQGDVSASHKSNVSAKQKLAGVLSRIGTLGKGLHDLAMNGMSEGELQRRTDMVARLQDDCEKLGKMVTVARQFNRSGTDPTAPYSPASMNPASASDREALLGPTNTFTRVTRVFGQPSKPQETEVTRPLDDLGLFGLQKTQMQQQDDQLSQLTTILSRQKQLGHAINSEINEQIAVLDGLANDVDNVGDKLSKASRQMHRLG
ncbi:syntaxin [Lentinula edodes]|uniref:syntaxin n=1 Tax=Lentinula edodes TaxID=5353 RepID=UPI001E8E4BD6|nr:syntaxin [Lentinula edodes]KAH7880663.1 syntaxin [Lentinula edodes]KAJ3920655.1 syntaxin [Lentinula edodes]